MISQVIRIEEIIRYCRICSEGYSFRFRRGIEKKPHIAVELIAAPKYFSLDEFKKIRA
jgi:hypothetical protein